MGKNKLPKWPPNQRLKEQRLKRLWSQAKVAELLGTTEINVSRWERGDTFPTLYYREKLCEIFKTGAQELGLNREEVTDRNNAPSSIPPLKQDSRPALSNAKPESILPSVAGSSIPLPSHPHVLAHRTMLAMPPPTDPRTIEQREQTVKDLYAQLVGSDITAIVVTGIGGVGKSTLAALVYRYAEAQRRANNEPFTADALWLRIDPSVTMADLLGTLFEALGKPIPDLGNLSPHSQALALFTALNTTSARLVVLDQFENLLDWQTGNTLPDRSGVGEWLDAINSQPCTCRVLLTSRPWPRGTREYPPTYMQEFPDKGLEETEGRDLLCKRGVQASEEELCMAVKRCDGHAFALTLLASLLHQRHLSLGTLLNSPDYVQLWIGDIARNLLDSIYQQQLNQLQRQVLLAFSVYREPVPLEAGQAIMGAIAQISAVQLERALDALLVQHLLQASEEGCYQLHAIVASYAQEHFVEGNENANQLEVKAAHGRAALYYQHHSAIRFPLRGQRRRVSDVHPLIEAVWQYCQAGRWQSAYDLLEQEGLFVDLNRWGDNAILQELYQLLLPVNSWCKDRSQAARIYNSLGEVYDGLWQKDRALECYAQALSIYQELGDRRGEALALDNLGGIYRDLSRKESALEYFEQALSIYEEIGDRVGEGTMLNNLGWIYLSLGEKRGVLKHYKRALRIHREIGNRAGESMALNGLGLVYNELGLGERALKYLKQALQIRKEIGDRGGEGRTLNNLAQVSINLERQEQALEYLKQALQIRKEIGDRGGEGITLNTLGTIYTDLGQTEQAEENFKQALSIHREVGNRGGEAWALNSLGEVYFGRGQREKALIYYGAAINIRREIAERKGEGKTLQNIGKLCFAERRYEIAFACFLLASSIFEEIQSLTGDETRKLLEALRRETGEDHFAELRTWVEPRAYQLVEEMLNANL